MEFEYDPERLIDEIKIRPPIWDMEHPDYRIREIRMKCWREVVTELLDGTEISKSELRELELQLQKKWKGIKDCYAKYRQNKEKWRRPYVYTAQLQFLHKNADDQPTLPETPVTPEPNVKVSKKRTKSTTRKKKKVKVEEETSEDDDFVIETLDDSNDYTLPDQSANQSNAEATPFAFANVDSAEDDPDKMFLVSLLPHLKAVPESERLKAKMQLMQVLRNAEGPSNGYN